MTDHGIGIEQAKLQHIFMPFVQLSSGTTKTHQGSGIGLALVRLVAAAQGGKVEVQSVPRQGSQFTLTLPRILQPAESAE